MTTRESVRSRLAALKTVAEELNETSDAVTEELKLVDSELAKLNLGVEFELAKPIASGPCEEELDDDGRQIRTRSQEFRLAYGRHARDWHLLVRTYSLIQEPSVAPYEILEETRPLVDASRELRLRAAERLEAFLDQLAAEAQQKLAVLRKVSSK